MNKRILSLKKLSNGLLKNGTKEMTGRSRGIRIREAIEKELEEVKGIKKEKYCDFGLAIWTG